MSPAWAFTAVFVTHDQTEAMSMSDKIAVLDGGVVQQYDTPEEIYHHPATRFVAHFMWANPTGWTPPASSGPRP